MRERIIYKVIYLVDSLKDKKQELATKTRCAKNRFNYVFVRNTNLILIERLFCHILFKKAFFSVSSKDKNIISRFY